MRAPIYGSCDFPKNSYTNEIVKKSPQQQFEGNEIMFDLRSST